MIRFFIPMVFTLLASVAAAQAPADPGEPTRDQMRTEKASLMYSALQLDEKQSEKFWPIYRKYEESLDQIIDERLELLQLYAGNYKIMSDEKAEIFARNAFALSSRRMKLREDYYKKFARALNPIIAARFAQIDNQIDTLLDLEILRMLPLIATPEELGLSAPAN